MLCIEPTSPSCLQIQTYPKEEENAITENHLNYHWGTITQSRNIPHSNIHQPQHTNQSRRSREKKGNKVNFNTRVKATIIAGYQCAAVVIADCMYIGERAMNAALQTGKLAFHIATAPITTTKAFVKPNTIEGMLVFKMMAEKATKDQEEETEQFKN